MMPCIIIINIIISHALESTNNQLTKHTETFNSNTDSVQNSGIYLSILTGLFVSLVGWLVCWMTDWLNEWLDGCFILFYFFISSPSSTFNVFFMLISCLFTKFIVPCSVFFPLRHLYFCVHLFSYSGLMNRLDFFFEGVLMSDPETLQQTYKINKQRYSHEIPNKIILWWKKCTS